jgi:chromosome segregation ATPase
LTEQLKSVSAQVEQLTSERDAAQSKLTENQTQLEAIQNELAKVKEATEEVKAKAAELEKAANKANDAEAERTQAQSALDEANKEIERLKTALEQQKASPPEQGDSLSPPPEE